MLDKQLNARSDQSPSKMFLNYYFVLYFGLANSRFNLNGQYCSKTVN